MSLDQIRTGCVIRFPYLWVREAERGETEGRKPRPVAVGVRIGRRDGHDVLVLFPITCAVNLKFLSVSRRVGHRNFKFKTALELKVC